MHNLNLTLFHIINGLALTNVWWDTFFLALTTGISILLFVVIIGYLLIHHHKTSTTAFAEVVGKYRELFSIGLTLVVTYVIVEIIKTTVASPRPFLAVPSTHILLSFGADNSFPSGHAAIFSALAVSIYPFHRPLSYVVGVLALLIGFSRIYVGVHYPIDVVVGFIIGVSVAFIIRAFVVRHIRHSKSIAQ